MKRLFLATFSFSVALGAIVYMLIAILMPLAMGSRILFETDGLVPYEIGVSVFGLVTLPIVFADYLWNLKSEKI